MSAWPCLRWNDPAAPPLVLLHGFLGEAREWAQVAAALPERHCVAFDLPGHGAHRLAGPSPDAPAMAQGLRAALAALGLTRPALLGYSMGGRVALELATQAPGACSALILESASAGLEGDEARAARRRLDEARAAAMRADLSAFVEDWYQAPLFAGLASRPAVLAQVKARGAGQRAEELAAVLVSMSPGAQPPRWSSLAQLGAPTLCVAGALDGSYRAQMARAASLLPRGVYVELPGVGHSPHREAPAAFGEVARGFLRDF